MQNIHQTVPSAPNPHSEPFDTRPYSGLAILLNNAQIAETPTHNTN